MAEIGQIPDSKTMLLGPTGSPASLNGTTTSSSVETAITTTNTSISGASDDSESQQDQSVDEQTGGIKFEEWGFKIDRLFEVAYRFYKKNESKAFHPSYDIRNQMNALILQARYGNFDGGRVPELGTLDLVGKNRRYQWSLLKGMSKTEAMYKFICTLDDLCPFFKAYAEAVRISSNSSNNIASQQRNQFQNQQSQHRNQESDYKSKDSWSEQNEQLLQQFGSSETEDQLNAIHTSLNRQTYDQFKGYAAKQYPNDPSKQKSLIATLQEQYYQQYISQMQPELSGKKQQADSEYREQTSDVSSCAAGNGGGADSNGNCSMVSPTSSTNSSVCQPPATTESLVYADNQLLDNNMMKQAGGDGGNSAVQVPQQQQPPPLNHKPQESMMVQQGLPIYQQLDQQPSLYQEPPLFTPYQEPIQPLPSSLYELPQTTHQELPQLYQQSPSLYPLPSPSLSYDQNQSPLQEANNKIIGNNHREISSAIYPSPYMNFDSTVNYQQQQQEQQQQQYHHQQVQMPPEASTSNGCQVRQVDSWSCGTSSGDDSPLQQSITYEPLEAASVWTKKGVNEFKESLIDDSQGGSYVVRQGTLLTIRVPTYPGGKYIYWEFATEDYDIGFGLDFIFETNLSKPLALKIYEDEDDDDDDYLEDLSMSTHENYDLESMAEAYRLNGANQRDELLRRRAEKFARTANTISIVPTYRRDSHEDIFVGRHRYPGQGYYLLKFDNTYSVLRAKTLLFRICYFI